MVRAIIFGIIGINKRQKVFNQVGPARTSDVYQQFKSDIQLMKQTGTIVFGHRFNGSVVSTRYGRCQQAVDFYNAYIDELIANGIEPL